MLTSKNKCKLPGNSLHGVYLVNCHCGKKYALVKPFKVSSRMEQHTKSIRDEYKLDLTGVSNHAKTCNEGFD